VRAKADRFLAQPDDAHAIAEVALDLCAARKQAYALIMMQKSDPPNTSHKGFLWLTTTLDDQYRPEVVVHVMEVRAERGWRMPCAQQSGSGTQLKSQ
jgi:hypothetical protein